MVVYKIKCDSYNQAYINKTKKIVIFWIKEHNNESKDSAIHFPTNKEFNTLPDTQRIPDT